jgi:hypothetical protein
MNIQAKVSHATFKETVRLEDAKSRKKNPTRRNDAFTCDMARKNNLKVGKERWYPLCPYRFLFLPARPYNT